MCRRHVLYKIQYCLRGIKIFIFLFVLWEKELGFPFIPAEKSETCGHKTFCPRGSFYSFSNLTFLRAAEKLRYF